MPRFCTRLVFVTVIVMFGALARVESALAFVCVWTGNATTNGVPDNRWSLPANWNDCGGRAPGTTATEDSLTFNDGAKQPISVNDLGQDATFGSVAVLGTGRNAANARVAWAMTGARIIIKITVQIVSTPDDAGRAPSWLIPLKRGQPASALTINVPSPGAPVTTTIGDIDLDGGEFRLVADTPVAVTGVISGQGVGFGFVKIGASVLTLNDNTYTGPTHISEGTVVAAHRHALGVGADEVIVFADGVISLANGVAVNRPITLRGGALTVPAGAAGSFAGPVHVGDPFGPGVSGFLDPVGSLTITGRVTADDGSALIQRRSGSTLLANPSNAFATYILRRGTLRPGTPTAIPKTVSLTLSENTDTATLDLNNVDVTVGTLEGAEGGRVQLGSHTLTVNPQANQNASFHGVIAGTGNVVKTGAGVFDFDGPQPNTYTGTTTVQAGPLGLGKRTPNGAIVGSLVVNGGEVTWATDDQIADNVDVTVNGAGILHFRDDGTKETIGSLSGNGQVRLFDPRRTDSGNFVRTLIVGANNASTTFAGTIIGGRAAAGLPADAYARLVKIGKGTLTLTGDSAIGDQAFVEAGTLAIDGRLNGRGVVARGGTLAGTGTLVNEIGPAPLPISTLQAIGGAIGPGRSPGVLHAGAAEIGAGGSLVIEINGAAAGTGYDQLDLTGNLTLTGGAQLVLTRTFAAPRGATFTIVTLAATRSTTGTFAGLAEGATVQANGQSFTLSYHGGDGNDIVLTAVGPPPPITYFLSEGATGPFFDEDVLIANPHSDAADVTLTFSKENGEQVVETRTLAPQSRATVHVDTIAGLESTAASVQVRSERGLPLIVERSMFWDQTHYAGHTGSAVDAPSADWFFAEGSQGFFKTFVLVINPQTTPADVTFTFFLEEGVTVERTIAVGAASRLTLYAGNVPELIDRSFGIAVHATQPIMAERAMYFGITTLGTLSGGHASSGVTAASNHWFLAEGATGGFFDTFVLLSNPNASPANVTLQYLLPTGESISVPKTIAAHARLTTNIDGEADERLHDAAVSTVVTSDVPIIAERSMYWPGVVVPWGEGHNSFGVVDAGTRWGLAEGRVGAPFNYHTYILLANPQTAAAEVTVTYLRENGAAVVKTYTVPPTSRFNIDTGAIDELRDESFGAAIVVTNNVPIIVERSLYWDANGIQFSGGTNATAVRLP